MERLLGDKQNEVTCIASFEVFTLAYAERKQEVNLKLDLASTMKASISLACYVFMFLLLVTL